MKMKLCNLAYFKGVLFVLLASFWTSNIFCQVYLESKIKAASLTYNSIGGVSFVNGIEIKSNKSNIIFYNHLIYAIGNRDFDRIKGEYYTLVDGANRQDYPLPGIIPGFRESTYLKVLNLKSAKTMDYGFTLSYGYEIVQSAKNSLYLALGMNFSWVEESSIKYEYNGNLTNLFGTTYDIYLIAPFTQKFFDLGPQLAFKYYFNSKNISSFGIDLDATWLTKTGFKYSIGPTFRVKL